MIKIGDKVKHVSSSIKGFGEVVELNIKENLVVVIFPDDKKFSFGVDEISEYIELANEDFKMTQNLAELELERAAKLADIEKKKTAKLLKWAEELKSLTNKGMSFSKLDHYFLEEQGLDLTDYKKIKDDYLSDYFLDRIKLEVNHEQLDAIQEINNHLLLKARAGSGKTRVITAKTFFLLDHEKYLPNAVMLLAFNRSAAMEIKKRLNKDYKLLGFNNARTFHSLAFRLGNTENLSLLFDEDDFSVSTQKQSSFIQDLIKDVASPVFKKKLYDVFRNEAEEIETLGELLSDDDYLSYRKNLVNITLNGDKVKSIGEKWIGDFLFEHDISHYYEQSWKGKDGGWVFKQHKGTYKPDFSLIVGGEKPDVVIEHWGIDENDTNGKLPDYWDKTWNEYREQMSIKRKYWETYNTNKPMDPVVLIETSIVDMANGRDYFENILKNKLIQLGVSIKKLSDDELFNKLEKIHIARITQLFKSFIGNATKRRLSPDDIDKRIVNFISSNRQINGFYELSANIYRRYLEKLKEENKLDFDGLIESAIKKINDTKGECRVDIDDNNSIAINQLKYLMIDEYQDFSPLFYEMIQAIMRHNKDVLVFCVGDDWQAINSFAGSDLHYFENFTDCFDKSIEKSLLTNYRSGKNIVDLSNKLMDGLGEKSIPKSDFNKFIGQSLSNSFYIDSDVDYLPSMNNNFIDYEIAKQLKFCHKIITYETNLDRINNDNDFNALIINRTNDIGSWFSKEKFKNNLYEMCKGDISKDNFNKIRITTAHGSKGSEANIVILLNVNNKKYPLVHPDQAFNLIFDDQCIENSLQEEKRLFYVAMTRAKDQLFFVSDEINESDFFKDISINWVPLEFDDLLINRVPPEVIKK